MRVAIIGQGYVGLTIAVGAAGTGHEVVGFDVNEELVNQLNSATSHIEGISDAELKNFLSNKTYTATTDASSVNGCDVIVIAVPTPLTESREPDLSFVHAAVELIQNNVKTPTLVINESTSYPGTLRKVIAARINGIQHLYASSPERVDPGNANWSTKNEKLGGIGGAMDLISGASELIIVMEHCDSKGRPELKKQCGFPLTGKGCVSYVVTDLALLQWREDRFVLLEVAPGFTADEVIALTDMRIGKAADIGCMA